MALTLYFHPLSSFSWKVLIALYENATPFEGVVVDGSTFEQFAAVWPMGKFPVLVDGERGEIVPESSAILDYLDLWFPGATRFTPQPADAAWRTRLWDRFFDLHLHQAVQRIVGDRIRPADAKDPFGVDAARAQLGKALSVAEAQMGAGPWFGGAEFGLVDCAAAPALFYADKLQPFGAAQGRLGAYLERLKGRPAFARVLQEAEPYFAMFPQA